MDERKGKASSAGPRGQDESLRLRGDEEAGEAGRRRGGLLSGLLMKKEREMTYRFQRCLVGRTVE